MAKENVDLNFQRGKKASTPIPLKAQVHIKASKEPDHMGL
jgi:hypothetical protein